MKLQTLTNATPGFRRILGIYLRVTTVLQALIMLYWINFEAHHQSPETPMVLNIILLTITGLMYRNITKKTQDITNKTH